MQIQVPEGSSLRIALVQMRCEKAAIDQNLRIMSDVLGAASRRTVDIVAFPEMSITGYADPTRYPQAVLTLDCPQVNRFLEITRDFPGIVLAGLIEANPGGKPFITQIIAHQRQLAGLYRKITIEDEELLWFSPG